MKKFLVGHTGLWLSLIFGVIIFLFWDVRYPHALNYQEQYQLFLWTGDYLVNNLSLPGGLACYIGEFLTQFYYIGWLGALILAVLFVLLQILVCKTIQSTWCEESKNEKVESTSCKGSNLSYSLFTLRSSFIISFIPAILLLWYMGDESVLLSYPVALILTLACYSIFKKTHILYDIIIIPFLYWIAGPMVWLYAILRVLRHKKWRGILFLLYIYLLQMLAYNSVLRQWPLESVLFGVGYYRMPLHNPPLQTIIPLAIIIAALIAEVKSERLKVKGEKGGEEKGSVLLLVVALGACLVLGICADIFGYDKDKYELIKQDYLVRNERWDDVIRNAEKYCVSVNFWSECVNLSLAMTGQLAQRQFSFYQSGTDALIMPMVRDLTSNLPSMEAFYRLGLVNECMRYAFDLQESIPFDKKSGRLCKRIVECSIINGKYGLAQKHIDLLKKSTFYRKWAKDAEQYLYNEGWIDNHPVWGRLRQLRFRDDFLFYYPELQKILGNLFLDNKQNKMALEYFLAQTLLNGDVQGFMQYIALAQQFGGYSSMPYTYQDAYKCIQAHGNLPGSRYAEYAKKMTMTKQKIEEEESAH